PAAWKSVIIRTSGSLEIESRPRELPTFPRDGPIFLRPDHEDSDSGIGGRDVVFRSTVRVRGTIEFEAKKLQLAAGRGSYFWRVLSDSRSEHQGINASQHAH